MQATAMGRIAALGLEEAKERLKRLQVDGALAEVVRAAF